jgi:hypothetical protein
MQTIRTLRGNLAAANFPFISDFQGRTIIIPQYDSNYDRQLNSAADPDKDKGIPQVFYMHNCIPAETGYQSVGYTQLIAAANPAQTDFDQYFVLRDTSENKALFVPSTGKNYVYTAVSAAWNSINPLVEGSFPSTGLVTVSYIHKRTFVYYEKVGAFEYDFTTAMFSSVSFTGLTPTNIKGICSAVGYNIAFDDFTIYWSSATGETDFVPSLVTGAGSEIPNDLKGKIVAILPVPQGFFIYSTKNVVSAFYSGNVRFPWIFREIPNSAGITSTNNVGWQATLSLQYAWTTAGLMKLDRGGAEEVFPGVTDFISSHVFEDFDEVTEVFTTTYTLSNFKSKLTFVGSRYLIFSYGISSLTHALLYDTTLKRWGKLKITHIDVFEWPAPNFFGVRSYDQLSPNTYDDLVDNTYDQLSQQQFTTSSPRKDLCFLQQDGTVQLVNFDIGNTAANGVLFIGKYQFVRSSFISLLATELECIRQQSTNFVHKWLTTFDGKFFQATNTPMLMSSPTNSLVRRYQGRTVGQNHTLYIKGAFNLVSFLIEFVLTGGQR